MAARGGFTGFPFNALPERKERTQARMVTEMHCHGIAILVRRHAPTRQPYLEMRRMADASFVKHGVRSASVAA